MRLFVAATLVVVLQTVLTVIFIFGLLAVRSSGALFFWNVLFGALLVQWALAITHFIYRIHNYRRGTETLPHGRDRKWLFAHGALSLLALLWMSCVVLHGILDGGHDAPLEIFALIGVWIAALLSGIVIFLRKYS